MSRLDVMKSLLRSAATEAGGRLERLSRSGPVKRLLDELTSGRNFIADAQLTAALARIPEATAATVSTQPDGLYVDATFADGASLRMRMLPEGVTFAQHGAKELRMRVSPGSAALDTHASDALVAIAEEIARALWGPFLLPPDGRSGMTAVQRDADVLILDLRSLPAVRAALAQRLRAVGMETVTLQGLSAEAGGLRLLPKIAGF